MVGELVIAHDQVGLPGVGTFVAEMVPASFSDKGFTINPPYRRLSFYPGIQEDSLLIDFYAASNLIDREAARIYITQYLAELRSVLEERKTVTLPGLGRLRATRENTLFFVPDEGLDIFPAGIGLRPVSLKSHLIQDDPVVIKVPLPLLTEAPEPAPAAEPETPVAETPAIEAAIPEEPEPEAEPEPEVEPEVPVTGEPQAEPEAVASEEPAEEPEVPAEEPVVEAPPAEPGIPEEPAAEEPAAEEPVAEAPVSEEPAAEEPAAEPEAADTPAEPEIPTTDTAAAEVRKKKGMPWWAALLLTLVILAVLALAVFLILARVSPDFIDSILYTPEELRILNY